MKKILVVCTGNTCRSPFAEAYFNRKFGENGMNVCASSAGLFVTNSSSPCKNAEIAASDFGVGDEFNNHKSKMILSDDIITSDIIFAVSSSHYDALKPAVDKINAERSDGKNTKLVLLGENIDDPYGGDVRTYKECYTVIARCIDKIIGEL